MSTGFTKLFSSIVTSTIWQEDDKTRIVWITLLALADAQGRVEGSVPGLAHVAHVGLGECEHALERLSSPDIYSRTKDFEGRRIENIDAGWRILNYQKYRDRRDPDKRREQTREAVRRHRDRRRSGQRCKPNVSQCKPKKAQAEAEAEAENNPPMSPQGGIAPEKQTFGEFVRLTTEEHAKLVERFGEQGATERIEVLNCYLGSTGKRYKSHYYTILNWARRDTNGKAKHDRSYDDRHSDFGDTVTV